MRFRLSLIATVAVCACSPAKNTAPTATSGTEARSASAEITAPEWHLVDSVNNKYKYYVNRTSIFPYNDMTMAEIAMSDGSKFMTVSKAYDCKKRLFVRLGTDGTVTPPAPVQTFLQDALLFNYVCFGRVEDEFEKEPLLSSFNVIGPVEP